MDRHRIALKIKFKEEHKNQFCKNLFSPNAFSLSLFFKKEHTVTNENGERRVNY